MRNPVLNHQGVPNRGKMRLETPETEDTEKDCSAWGPNTTAQSLFALWTGLA